MSNPARARCTGPEFERLYAALYPDVVRFAQRRSDPAHAEDVAAEVFLVVWRRLDELPGTYDDSRAWVFGIARNVLLNLHRGDDRRRALAVRLRDTASDLDGVGGVDAAVATRVDLGRAWARLSERHQEVLALSVFEGLDARQAGVALDISPVAFRLRLSRARRALRTHLEHLPRSATTAAGAPDRSGSHA